MVLGVTLLDIGQLLVLGCLDTDEMVIRSLTGEVKTRHGEVRRIDSGQLP